jgi:predicted TIM-barrel fold metal-dependent hydrolase
MTLKKIDPHHHLWKLSSLEKASTQSTRKETYIGDYQKIFKNYLVEDYLRDVRNQNVEKSVVIQSGWDPNNPGEETEWLQSVIDKNGFPNAIIAFADLSKPNAESLIAAHCQYPNVRGIRQILSWHKNPDYSACAENYIEMPDWQRNFGLLKKYKMSFDMQVFSVQMPKAAELAKKHPDIQIIINHSGMPLFEDKEDADLWKKDLKLLGLLPNIAIKISGLGMFNHEWNVESIRPLVRYMIEVFGIERCMFASNFPVDGLYSDYDAIFKAFSLIVEDLKPHEQKKLFYENAAHFYRL